MGNCKPQYKGKRYNSLEEIKEIIKKEYVHKDGIKIDELPLSTTLNDLAEIMAYGNNKIILPGWKIEYSTPLGNKYDTLGEVNQEIRGLANNILEPIQLTQEQEIAIDSVWNEYPELKEIFKGNKSLYQHYLNSIFPGNKVKDIVYHGTDTKFERFDKLAVNKLRGKSRTEFIHFTTSFDLAMDYSAQALGYADAADMYKKAPEKMDDLMQVIPALIRGNKLSNENVEYGSKFELEQKGISVKDTIFKFGYDLAVFEPEQIHILGSKQDIEGFKEFVKKGNSTGINEDPLTKCE